VSDGIDSTTTTTASPIAYCLSDSPLARTPGIRLVLLRTPLLDQVLTSRTPVPLPWSDLQQAAHDRTLDKWVRRENGVAYLELDIFAAALYLLSLREEQLNPTRDPNGRFLASHSAAPDGFFEVPVINRLFEALAKLLCEVLSLPYSPPREQQTIALTHDIDLVRKHGGAGAIGRSLGRMITSPSAGLKQFRSALAVNTGGQRDPYDSFDDLFAIKERISAQSTFFMMTRSGGQHDCDYQLNDANIRQLLLRARTFGDEIGVHPGWDSCTSADRFTAEAKAVASANGQPVNGSRQHYLRFTAPQTWRHAATAGLRYDASVGFPDRCGFKAGWSGVYRPFDLERMQEAPILEIPLICMDVTLAAYEKIPAELCLERLTNLLDASTDHIRGGAFVFLWHNTIADREMFPGYWDTFEYFFSIASGSARFVTLNQLCDEYHSEFRIQNSEL
jgi:hypothetical protein